jgi:hypothetical protein
VSGEYVELAVALGTVAFLATIVTRWPPAIAVAGLVVYLGPVAWYASDEGLGGSLDSWIASATLVLVPWAGGIAFAELVVRLRRSVARRTLA